MSRKDFATVVIGSGPAGYTVAVRCALAGMKTLLLEKSPEDSGGTCLNRGCIPVKSMIESAALYEKMRNAGYYGLECRSGSPSLADIIAAARRNTRDLKKGLYNTFKKAGVETAYAEASFRDEKSIMLGGSRRVSFENAVIATGSAPAELESMPVDGERVISSDHLMNLEYLPRKILIVGGGYIGCEAASFFSAFGSEVTVVEAASRLLPGADEDISRVIEKSFRRRGIAVLKDSEAEKISSGISRAGVRIKSGGSSEERSFDRILVAAGRKPFYRGLAPEKAGVETAGSAVKTDLRMRTSSPGIYAAGDVRGEDMLAHAAFRQGETAAAGITGNDMPEYKTELLPKVVFSFPQAAWAGVHPDEVKRLDGEAFTRKTFFRSNAKALIGGEREGFIKLVCRKKDRTVLSAAVVGPEACELIHIFLPALSGSLDLDGLLEQIYAHPTLSEAVSGIQP